VKRFVWRDGKIFGRFDELDLAVLGIVPGLIAGVGSVGEDPAAARLEPAVYRDDSERSAEFLRLAGEIVDDGRRADLEAFVAGCRRVIDGDGMTAGEAGSWARTLTTARLVVGARLGIEKDGWEQNLATDLEDPHVAVLFILGRLQEALMAAVSAAP